MPIGKKKTHEEFVKEVYSLVNEEYEVITKYENSKTKLTMRHNGCGNIYDVKPNVFLGGSRCPICSIKVRSDKKKKTQEQFESELYEVFGREYIVTGKYVGSGTKIEVRHLLNGCNHTWNTLPTSLLQGHGCPKCANNTKKTTEQFEQEVFALVKNEYEVLGEYVNTNTKVKMKHNNSSCSNYEYEVRPLAFLYKEARCPKCYGNIKKTHEEFVGEVYKLVGDEYTVLGKYENSSTKIWMRHNNTECQNHEYEVTPNGFSSCGSRCPKCVGKRIGDKLRKSHEDFTIEVFNLVGDEYFVLGEYVNNRTGILIKHNICSHEFTPHPYDFLNGSRCPKCYGNAEKDTNCFKNEVFELVGDEYTVLGEYEGAQKRIRIRHDKCNNEYDVKPNTFLCGHRCPRCNDSKGEIAILKWLSESDINYKQQYRFDGCRNKNPLPFDFAVFNDNNNLKMIIEYDGKQHFEPVNFGGISDERAKENFENTRTNDQIKNAYCKNNNITLLRIPYWEKDNVGQILHNYLIEPLDNFNGSFLFK